MYKQFEIRWVDLEPAKGSETKKKRPCVILQSNMININSRTFIVAPILPKYRDWPFAVNIKPTKKNGLDKERHINLKQLRVVDISRVDSKQGKIEEKYKSEIDNALKIVLGLSSVVKH